MKRWEMMQALFPTPGAAKALAEGWEPFAVQSTDQKAMDGTGRTIELSRVSFKRERSVVEVDSRDLRRVRGGA